jgi:sugar/nucleoside kinase (ribokinase family)
MMPGMRILLLGEALVDLICERPVAGLTEADAFVPHFGGAVANVAVGAARQGASVELAGGAGDDAWGAWLRARLADEGVGLTWFGSLRGVATPVAFVTVDADGEPSYAIYGDTIEAIVASLEETLLDAVAACDALFITSNTLVGIRERALTLAARDRAIELGKPIAVDPNLRLHRWAEPAQAASEARDLAKGAFLVKCNAEEARLLSGEDDPAAAAEGLLAMGAQHVVVTRGARGALLRGGGMKLDLPGAPATPVSTVGAGDAFCGVLLGRLAATGFYPPAIGAALPEAVAEAARAVERWGAL